MKLLLLLLTVLPTFTEWHDLQVNEINRLPVHAYWTPAERLSIDGEWKFKFVGDADQRPTDFYRTDLDDSDWDRFRTPATWETCGYGDPVYVNIGYAWDGHFKSNPPMVPVKDNHVGSYRRWIELPKSWNSKQVIIHFGAVSSCLYLYVNGQFVGYSEDSKTAAEFDITPFVRKGRNLIAMQVFRWCDGSYYEGQDFWRLSGISRESFLYCRYKKRHIDDVQITTDLTDDYRDGLLSVRLKTTGRGKAHLTLSDA